MIYFDHAASSPLSTVVSRNLARIMSEFSGNPSSLHPSGLRAKEALTLARATIAGILKCDAADIYFTSGATEAANILIQGYAAQLEAVPSPKNEIIVSAIEHPAVFNTVQSLQTRGWKIRVLEVDSAGQVNLRDLARMLSPQTAMVCIMAVNNEVGSIQNLNTISRLIKSCSPEILFLSDAVQALGKLPMDLLSADAFFTSGHKLGAPKGTGFFYLNPAFRLRPLTFGGGQENGYRPGTTDAAGALLLALALQERTQKLLVEIESVRMLNRSLLNQLTAAGIPHLRTVPDERCSPFILSLVFPGQKSRDLVTALSTRSICISQGSACSSTSILRSRVLQALNVPTSQAGSIVRISFAPENTLAEVDALTQALAELSLPVHREWQPEQESLADICF